MTLTDIKAGNIGGLPGGYQAMPASDAPATLEKIISNTVGFFTVVGGLTFIIYLVLAGLTWITAREEDARLSKAKQMFTNALVGLAIIVISWALAGIIGAESSGERKSHVLDQEARLATRSAVTGY